MAAKTEPMERCPEDVRLLKRFQRYCSLQREEILNLRTQLYKAEKTCADVQMALDCLKAMAK